MRKLFIVAIIAILLILGSMPFSSLFSQKGIKENVIIAGSLWDEANFGSVTAYSGNTINTTQYPSNIATVDGQPLNQVTVGNNAIKAKANQITALATTNYQKAQDLYIWISENITYDLNAYGVKDPAIYAFNNKKAVCTGFAGLYSAMCRDVGLSVRQIGGLANGKPHTWNQVYLNNQWINVDCTFASGLLTTAKKNNIPLSQNEMYLGLTVDKPLVVTTSYNTYTFGVSDYFNTPNFMQNRKPQYLIYEYNTFNINRS
ncbi:MAG: transglutaminase domain-containing protein [Sarcina sp.]